MSRGVDGQWRPAVSVADVAFSGGGAGPLVTLTQAGRTMTMSWPGVLPAPVVSGASVTYPGVAPDVDLVVRATETGFTHLLVIKSAAAAARANVREIHFRLGGNAQIQSGDGVLRALGAGGSVLASTEPAQMWDSRSATAPSARKLAASGSTPAGVGDSARTAPVSVAVAGRDLVLRPDVKLLTKATYPLFVDPTWSVFKAKWAYATDDGSSDTDYTRARVGRRPDTGDLYRSFFQFNTTANGVSLGKKHIESARVEMKLDQSYSCTDTVSSMYSTPAINATMQANWSAMKLSSFLVEAYGHGDEAGGCGVQQGDVYMQFQGAAVTQFLQKAADGSWSYLTVGFTARDQSGSGESVQDRWKKFYPNDAKLFVDYDTPPGKPLYLQAAGVNCVSGVLTIGTLTPTFSAYFTDADKSDSLTGVFEWIEVPAAGIGAVTDTSPARKTPPPNKTAITPPSRTTTATVTTVKGPKYAFRARAVDKAPYSISSGWGPWCQFTVDTAVPPVTATVITTPAGPGKTGRIRIESTATDVTKFQYGWDAATKVVAASGTSPKYAEVDVTAPSFGYNVLLVKAIDATLNEGNGSVEFRVGRPALPTARWGLETYPGIDSAAALADRVPAPIDSPLSAANVTWTPDVHLKGGTAATFNGASSATTTSAVLSTTGSFSVGGWVQLGATAADMTFATQDGTDAAGFELGVRRTGSPVAPHWALLMRDTSAQSGTTVTVLSPAAAVVGRWTHVAGTYDAAEKKLRLYVDGVLVAQADRTATPWSAAGKFAVGRGLASGAPANFWTGSIADVQVFDRVLEPQDFTGQLASDPASGGFDEPGILTPMQVGGWNFDTAKSCKITDRADTCEAPDSTTAWGRWLALTRGADIDADRSGSGTALGLDNQPVAGAPDTSATGPEYGRSAVKAGLTSPDADGHQSTLWQNTSVLRTDQSFSISAWAMLGDATGSRAIVAQRGDHESAFFLKFVNNKWQFLVTPQDNTATGFYGVTSDSDAQEGVWTLLTGVYDAARQQIRLYVNGTLAAAPTPVSFTPFSSTGPLLVGQTFYHDALVDQWDGAIDDVAVYQGALSDAAVSAMFDAQAAADSGANVLGVSQSLHDDTSLMSGGGRFWLVMQTDGNLVLYDNSTPIWDTKTRSATNADSWLVMQPDNNLVIYTPAGDAVWRTNTRGTGANRLVLYDDGDLVLLDPTGQVVWRR